MDYVIPTKKSPTFVAENDYYGFIDAGCYKSTYCGNSTTYTFALNYEEGIKRLHQYIKDLDGEFHSKTVFNLYMMDGTVQKNGDSKLFKVYSISAKKAKLLLLPY